VRKAIIAATAWGKSVLPVSPSATPLTPSGAAIRNFVEDWFAARLDDVARQRCATVTDRR
jgi:hypothetical protein